MYSLGLVEMFHGSQILTVNKEVEFVILAVMIKLK